MELNIAMQQYKIKIFGERNTGTHYLDNLIKSNLEVIVIKGIVPKILNYIIRRLPNSDKIKDIYFNLTSNYNLGWKHRELDDNLFNSDNKKYQKLIIITITKNPYSWLLSLYKRPYHSSTDAKLTFEEFLENTWISLNRESKRQYYVNPIDMWNKKNSSYLRIANNFNVIHLKYEDLLSKPEKLIENISHEFKINHRLDKITNIENSTKDSNKNYTYYQNYYGNELWKNELTPEAIKIINKYIDQELMKYFQYDFIK